VSELKRYAVPYGSVIEPNEHNPGTVYLAADVDAARQADIDRIATLEKALQQAADALQKVHSIGAVKAIGLREVGE
jgi:hypothetical protein